MQIGMTLPSMVPGYARDTTLRWCERIDDGPWSSIAVGERITFANQEQLVLLSAAAALTHRVRIIPSIVITGLHPVAVAAKQLATLDVLSGGRLDVGLGVGSRPDDFAAAERPDDRTPRQLERFAGELRRLWAGGAPATGGEPVGPPPAQPGGPALLGSSMGPLSLAAAARFAAGNIGFTLSADRAELELSVAGVRAAWAAAGREEAPRVLTSTWMSLGPDAEARHRAYVDAYLRVEPAALPLVDIATVHGDAAVRAALDAAESAGIDEILIVPTTTDERELDRLEAIVAAR